jgi:hypothetical protein
LAESAAYKYLVDPWLREARRFRDLLLRESLLSGFADEQVSLGIQLLCAADLLSYLSKLGQRVFAGHALSLMLKALLVAIAALLLSRASTLKVSGLPLRPASPRQLDKVVHEATGSRDWSPAIFPGRP